MLFMNAFHRLNAAQCTLPAKRSIFRYRKSIPEGQCYIQHSRRPISISQFIYFVFRNNKKYLYMRNTNAWWDEMRAAAARCAPRMHFSSFHADECHWRIVVTRVICNRVMNLLRFSRNFTLIVLESRVRHNVARTLRMHLRYVFIEYSFEILTTTARNDSARPPSLSLL